MLTSPFRSLYFAVLVNIAFAAVHPAKRQFDTIQDVCGTDAVDCENGWCCTGGQECIDASPEPLCRDLLLTQPGGDPITLIAFPYSSFIADLSSIGADIRSLDSELRSQGITLPTTFPTTLTGTVTALPTYTDNVLPTSFDVSESPRRTSGQSTGAATLPTVHAGVMVGAFGMVGAGVFGVV